MNLFGPLTFHYNMLVMDVLLCRIHYNIEVKLGNKCMTFKHTIIMNFRSLVLAFVDIMLIQGTELSVC